MITLKKNGKIHSSSSSSCSSSSGSSSKMIFILVPQFSMFHAWKSATNIRQSGRFCPVIVNVLKQAVSDESPRVASFFGVLLARSFLIIYRPRRYHEEEPRQQQPERSGTARRGSNRTQLLTLSRGTRQGRIPSIVDG
ncbi:hypothetical protein Tsp_00107 [Trichinella spiralis]|uniref:hypothetical protein n=1 Tax=Trichinella spiralis TaxID=6334 RepID=UPI0001EFBE43|nr:hypothetical protein Tsp_00107 [Trichinella spiralis]